MCRINIYRNFNKGNFIQQVSFIGKLSYSSNKHCKTVSLLFSLFYAQYTARMNTVESTIPRTMKVVYLYTNKYI